MRYSEPHGEPNRADPGKTRHVLRCLHSVDFDDPRRILLPNNRLDIVTVIWPALKAALFEKVRSEPRLTDRLSAHFPMGDYLEQLAGKLSTSPQLHSLGLARLSSHDLSGVVTFDQLCERINDLLESVH